MQVQYIMQGLKKDLGLAKFHLWFF